MQNIATNVFYIFISIRKEEKLTHNKKRRLFLLFTGIGRQVKIFSQTVDAEVFLHICPQGRIRNSRRGNTKMSLTNEKYLETYAKLIKIFRRKS